MRRIENPSFINAINEKVAEMLSKISLLRETIRPFFTGNDSEYLYQDSKGFYDVLFLDHGDLSIDYLGKDESEIVDYLVKKQIEIYAVCDYEPDKRKYQPYAHVTHTNWDVVNEFVSDSYKVIFPNTHPPVLPKEGLLKSSSN